MTYSHDMFKCAEFGSEYVVSSEVMAADVTKLKSAKTVEDGGIYWRLTDPPERGAEAPDYRSRE